MKKNQKLLKAASVMTVLALAAAFPAAAEEGSPKRGWQMEDGRWVFLDGNGDRVTSTWKKGQDGTRYYLDEDGYMAVNAIIKDGDEIYYTDENGARVKNRWVSEPNEDSLCDQDVDVVWYYFGKDGKAQTQEGKGVKLKEGSAERVYFFDSDGHMLSGWQEITNKNGDKNIYYLGDENQGHVHKQWQYLEPDEDMLAGDHDYDSYEMFYFGWDGKMSRSDESEVDGKHFLFDENGVMHKGWSPGITPHDGDFGVNRYYDEETGERAEGWIYAYDPDDENSDPHWFYCDKNKGFLYNEGGKDCDEEVGYKRIDGKTYFFDDQGHMITGLISTNGTDLEGNPYMESEFSTLRGDIGKGNGKKAAGIYYLSQEEGTLGQLQADKKLCLGDSYDDYTYYLDSQGRAYQNAMVKGAIYQEDGTMLHADSDSWEAVTVGSDIYQSSDYTKGILKESAQPVIPEGSIVIVSRNGKVKKSGKNVKVNDERYDIDNYVAVLAE